MSENSIAKINIIQNRIFTIRGIQVMLDKDLAAFYDVKPIRLREQVKRNSKRFPADFMFQLTNQEVEYVDYMVSQNAIPYISIQEHDEIKIGLNTHCSRIPSGD